MVSSSSVLQPGVLLYYICSHKSKSLQEIRSNFIDNIRDVLLLTRTREKKNEIEKEKNGREIEKRKILLVNVPEEYFS